MVMEAILEKTSEVTHMVMMLVVTSVHAGIYIVGQSWVSWSFLRWWSSWSLDQLHGETAGQHGGSKAEMQHGQWDGDIDC